MTLQLSFDFVEPTLNKKAERYNLAFRILNF